MHIPNHMLEGSVCPVTAVISVIGVVVASVFAVRAKNKPSPLLFGAITALIFAGQMMNFPVQNGTSGHLLGGMLAAALLGFPFGVLSMAVVVAVQCLVFSDGGTLVLGANILNMSLIGVGSAVLLQRTFSNNLRRGSLKYGICLAAAAWVSVVFAALACSIELSLAGTVPFLKVVVAMLNTHALIGIGEAGITVVLYYLLAANRGAAFQKKTVAVSLAAAGLAGGVLSPFASGFPDGLEWVAAKYNFLGGSAPGFVTPFSGYLVSFISNETASTAAAGLAGVMFTFFLAWAIAKIYNYLKGGERWHRIKI